MGGQMCCEGLRIIRERVRNLPAPGVEATQEVGAGLFHGRPPLEVRILGRLGIACCPTGTNFACQLDFLHAATAYRHRRETAKITTCFALRVDRFRLFHVRREASTVGAVMESSPERHIYICPFVIFGLFVESPRWQGRERCGTESACRVPA